MKLFSFMQDDQPGIGVDTGSDLFNLTKALEIYQKAQGVKQPVKVVFLQMLVEMGYCSGEAVDHILSNSWVQSKYESITIEPGFTWEVPVARPSNIICLGRNYEGHIRELSDKKPEAPLFFAKSPASLTAHKQDIILPEWLETRVDHEAELALVIGKTAKNVSEESAEEYIAGYTIVNDVTARQMQQEDIAAGNPWYRSKSLDTFCPTGPFLVPADTIKNPGNLNISLTVNGEQKQQANTSGLIFSIPRVVSCISAYLTLQPGDIISTGTPAGISEIKDGDTVEITIQDLGTLKNTVRKQQ